MSSIEKSAGNGALSDQQAPIGTSTTSTTLEGALPAAHNWPLRVRLALIAAWEIDSLADLLTQSDYFADEEPTPHTRARHSVLKRIKRLAGITMGAMCDEADDPWRRRREDFAGQDADFAGVAGGQA